MLLGIEHNKPCKIYCFTINTDRINFFMNGRLDKVAMTNKLLQLKRELHYKCEIGEMGEWECEGANKYLNKSLDVLDEYWQ